MPVPSAWVFVLGALAAWRIWKLFACDDVLDPVRDRVAPEGSRLHDFLTCPYCAGFWVSFLGTLGYYLLTEWDTYGFLVTTFAMSATVVFVEVVLDLTVAEKDKSEEEAPSG